MKIRNVAAFGVVLAGAAGASISLNSFSYSENFDTLPNAGTNPLTWTNDTTLDGWYARRAGADATQIRHDTGASNTGALYSYGGATESDRGLGSISSGSSLTQNWGVAFVNNTGSTITEFTLAYTGEQWREGGGSTLPPANVMDLGYMVVSGGSFSSALFDSANFTDLTGAFDFASVFPAQATATALNGNDPANRQTDRGGTVTGLSWAVGDVLILRWQDVDNIGSDDGLAVDDLSLTFVPSPGAMTLAAVGMAAMGMRPRRR